MALQAFFRTQSTREWTEYPYYIKEVGVWWFMLCGTGFGLSARTSGVLETSDVLIDINSDPKNPSQENILLQF
ncbi:hypothetical protein QUF72_20310 [Desulfobacterales bacterium HSG2]|nr:hypothetical protein [Desulfobacterales bacterium HSG2]